MRIVAAILALALSTAFASAEATERRVALVIGVTEYANTSDLTHPREDAQRIYESLRATGFDLPPPLDSPTKAQLDAALVAFSERARHADVALLYYAGHGMQQFDDNWLIPADASLARAAHIQAEGVPLEYIERYMEGANLRIIILDACRNNPFSRNWETVRSDAVGLLGIGDPPAGTVVAFSAAPRQVSPDDGAFARALAAHMRVEGLNLQQVFSRISDDLDRGANPPELHIRTGTDAFYFVPPTRAAEGSVDAALEQLERNYSAALNSGQCDEAEAYVSSLAASGPREATMRQIMATAVRSCRAAASISVQAAQIERAATSPFLSELRARDTSRLSRTQIEEAARTLGIDAGVLEAIARVESGGPGFVADRPLILFEPYWFSQFSDGRFDATHPAVSSASNRAPLGGNQASRWERLDQAYQLDPEAALSATSWGLYQIPGRLREECGFRTLRSMATTLSASESQQLQSFVRCLNGLNVVDALRQRNWMAFARAYEGEAGAASYAEALANASASMAPADPEFLRMLVADTPVVRLTAQDFAEVGAAAGVEGAALQAFAEVESGRLGAFGPDGRAIILFEPHIFSRRTNRIYDASHADISYAQWDASKYPRTQEGRWNQLRRAYELDPQNALASASWGLFQIMGFNHAASGYPDPRSFVQAITRTERAQLEAIVVFMRSNNLLDELQRRDWVGFARGYNGAGQADRYGALMAQAYDRITGVTPVEAPATPAPTQQ